MGLPREALPAPSIIDNREFDRFAGPGVFNDNADESGTGHRGTGLVDMDLVDRLALAHPDLRKNDITFGLVAAYMAGISKNGEAAFPVQDNRTLSSHGRYVPIRVLLHPQESFGMFLSHVLLSRIRMNGGEAAEGDDDQQTPVRLAVSFGNRTTPPRDAEIWLLCRDDGTIDWRHTDAVSPQAMVEMSKRMTELAERILDDLGEPVSVHLAA